MVENNEINFYIIYYNYLMKTFKINNNIIIFGSNAKENTLLVNEYKNKLPDNLWFHLDSLPSSHGISISLENKLNSNEINIIGNILLFLSKIKNGKYYLTYCKLIDVIPLKSYGLVNIKNYNKKLIKKINNFSIEDYKFK